MVKWPFAREIFMAKQFYTFPDLISWADIKDQSHSRPPRKSKKAFFDREKCSDLRVRLLSDGVWSWNFQNLLSSWVRQNCKDSASDSNAMWTNQHWTQISFGQSRRSGMTSLFKIRCYGKTDGKAELRTYGVWEFIDQIIEKWSW